jgi:hypothetical protein
MCTVEAYRCKYVYSARNVGKGSPFLSLLHILPICFDSAQVLYIYYYNTLHKILLQMFHGV